MIEIEESSGNVYADLQTPDAEAMYVKAQLASKIGDIVRHRHLTQQQAAEILGISVRTLRNKLHEYRMSDAALA